MFNIASPNPDNVRACYWAILATAMFSIAAVLAKIAVDEFHVLQILFFRQVVVFLSCLPSIAGSFPESLRTNNPSLHMLRLLGAFVALSCSIWAVAVLPLTTAVTLSFAQAFFIALLALIFLKETLGIHRFSALLLGFFGVVLVMQPDMDGYSDANMFIPILGALGAAIAVICVRNLSQSESTQTLLIYQSVFVGLIAAIPLLWLWKSPDSKGLFILIAMGVLATCGQWAGVKALRLGEATLVGTVKYTELVFATLLGFILFRELPSGKTVIGAAIIVASALYIIRRESRVK